MLAHLVSLFASLVLVSSEIKSQTFELPKLIIDVDHLYLHRKSPTVLSCQISPGWSEARMSSVQWLKDGEPVNEIKDLKDDLTAEDATLTVSGTKQQAEGDYQCVARLQSVRLSNRQYVETTLVSPPLKLRRARMTKFDRTTDHVVRAQQGEVARLPCIGMPDVIPGPPEVCFEKDGEADRCYGEKTDKDASKYLSTSSGLQIALVQPEDEGKYFCVVRNTYTNSTRKSPRSVDLKVVAAAPIAEDAVPNLQPQLIFPTKGSVRPITVDVVAGQDIVLECVFSKDTKVIWKKHDGIMPPLLHSDDTKPFRQLWGNLRIKNVSQGDAGVYSCHGLSPFESDTSDDDKKHPRANYKLVVHEPTTVNLTMAPTPGERSLQLSCLAEHLFYEIPMVYVNATPLINAIDQMGIPDETNFYTNPVNITIQVHRNFSGSVQCISRPAMDEAEIYGAGLERGRSDNVFVVSSGRARQSHDLITQGPSNTTVLVGQRADLTCVVQKAGSKFWKFLGTRTLNETFVKIVNSRMRTTGSNSLRIDNVQPEDEGWYTCIIRDQNTAKESSATAYLRVILPTTTTLAPPTTEPFSDPKKDENITIGNLRAFVNNQDARILWEVEGTDAAKARIHQLKIELRRQGGQWIDADTVNSHVPATTLRNLIPNTTYHFRVRAVREDGTQTVSQESAPFSVNLPDGDIKPETPQIIALEAVSSTALRVKWKHDAAVKNAQARSFFIFCSTPTEDSAIVQRVLGNLSEFDVSGLKPLTEYTVYVSADNDAGRSSPSKSATTRTLDASMENGLFDTLGRGLRQIAPNVEVTTVFIALGALLLLLVVLLIFCVIVCNLRNRAEKKSKGANGKFLDTSYRIFNEQKVHKSKLNTTSAFFNTDDADECSPLKMPMDRGSLNEGQGFTLSGAMPSVYGEVGGDVDFDEEPMHHQIDQNYVNTAHISSNGIYGTTATARCYSPESGTSHEMLVAPPPATTAVPPPMAPILPSIISSPQRVMAYKCPDSLLYSPAGTASSSLADSSGQQTRTTCDSPSNPATDGSDQGLRCGSSRNSQVSSSDGHKFMHTFKAPNPNCSSFVGGTFERTPKDPPNIYGL